MMLHLFEIIHDYQIHFFFLLNPAEGLKLIIHTALNECDYLNLHKMRWTSWTTPQKVVRVNTMNLSKIQILT